MEIYMTLWDNNKILIFQPQDPTKNTVKCVVGSAVVITLPTFEVRQLKAYTDAVFMKEECTVVYESGIISNLRSGWTREQVCSYAEVYRKLNTV